MRIKRFRDNEIGQKKHTKIKLKRGNLDPLHESFGSKKDKLETIRKTEKSKRIVKPNISNEEQKRLDDKLLDACKKGNINKARELLNKGADYDAKNNGRYTALMWASWSGHTDIVKLLLDKGADYNMKSKYGDTALMWASWRGHINIVKLLLDEGADYNAENKWGNTALMWASENNYDNISELLKKYGAKK